MPNGDDHDLLIKIDTKVGMIHDSYVAHVEKNAKEHERVEKKTDSAHKRLDWFLVSVVLSVLLSTVGILFKFMGS